MLAALLAASLALGQTVPVYNGNGAYIAAPLPPRCSYFVVWSPCGVSDLAPCTLTGDGCIQTSKLPTSVTSYGSILPLDMDRFTSVRLVFMGARTSGQAGIPTITLRNHTTGSLVLSSAIPTGTACANRTSASVDVSTLTGVHLFGVQVSSSAANTTPRLSSIVIEACQ